MGNVPPSCMTELNRVNSPARVVESGDASEVADVVVVVAADVVVDVVVDVVEDPEQAEPADRTSDAPATRNRRHRRLESFTSLTVISQSKKRLGIA